MKKSLNRMGPNADSWEMPNSMVLSNIHVENRAGMG